MAFSVSTRLRCVLAPVCACEAHHEQHVTQQYLIPLFRLYLQKLAADVPEDDLVSLVQDLNADPKIDGILVQVR